MSNSDLASRRRSPPRPVLWVAAGVLAGQVLAPRAPGVPTAVVVGGMGLLCLALVRCRLARMLGVALVAAAVGHARLDGRLHPQFTGGHIQRFAGAAVELRGRIAARPSRRPARTRFLIEVYAVYSSGTWQPAMGRVLATVRGVGQRWHRGDRVRAALRLRRPRNFGNPGEFDYEAYLARRGIYVTSFSASDRSWDRVPADPGPVAGRLDRWRDAAARMIDETVSPPAASILAALLLGEGPAIAPEVRERYARAGVSHVLAISGLHVGLVAAASYAASRWLLARSAWLLLRANVPKLAMVLSGMPVLLYAAIAGGSLATIRAVVMVLVVLTATLVNRQRDWVISLAAAATGICLWWPGSVFEISFQLSFISVAAIVLGMQRVTMWWNVREEERLIRLRDERWRLLRWLVLYQAVSVCALLGTAPLTAWHFNRLSLVAVVANPLVVPLLGLFPVSVGLVGVLAVPFAPGLATVLLGVVGAVVHCGDWLVGLCAALPGSAIRVVSPSIVELVLLYGLLATLLIPRRVPRLVLLVLCVLLLTGDAAYWYARRFHRAALEVTFLSVGQGDSTLIEFPGSAVMVIDGGGLSATFDVGERVIAPYLWRRKIARVDTLVMTHADFDHFGGLPFLSLSFSPDAMWWNGFPGRGVRFSAFWRAIREHDVPVITVARGFRRTIGGVEVLVLHPDATATGSQNNRSLILSLRYGPTTLLFPGDIEGEGEHALVAAYGGALASTILKVPHHGSRTSSSALFLRAVAPGLAVVSSGYRNRFAMPDSAVLDAYRNRGVALWRTDDDGAVTVRVTAAGAIAVSAARARQRVDVGRLHAVPRMERRRGARPVEG